MMNLGEYTKRTDLRLAAINATRVTVAAEQYAPDDFPDDFRALELGTIALFVSEFGPAAGRPPLKDLIAKVRGMMQISYALGIREGRLDGILADVDL